MTRECSHSNLLVPRSFGPAAISLEGLMPPRPMILSQTLAAKHLLHPRSPPPHLCNHIVVPARDLLFLKSGVVQHPHIYPEQPFVIRAAARSARKKLYQLALPSEPPEELWCSHS